MTTKKERMYFAIKAHGKALIALFNLPADTDPLKLCKALFSLERKAHHATTCLCNTNTLNLLELNKFTEYDVHQATEKEQDIFFTAIHRKLIKLIGSKNAIVTFINHDPRGYALKINSEFVKDKNIYKDWGGNGILAPDFSSEV